MQKPVVKALIEANPGLMKGSDAPPPATKPAPIVLPSLWLEFEAHCLAKGATPEEGVLWFKSHFGAPAKKKPDQPKSTGERYDLRRIKHGF